MKEHFSKTGLDETGSSVMEKLAFEVPTKIQSELIPVILEGKNVIGQSPTGTGKTLAYVLPLLQKIDINAAGVQAVVLAPTYELAMQIFRQVQAAVVHSGKSIRAASLIGGANISRQIDKLKDKPHIVVGSAGRIMELNRKRKLDLSMVKFLVLDEADRLLDDQNQDGINQIVKVLPDGKVQYILTTATVGKRALKRAEAFIKAPVWISVEDEINLPPTIEHHCFYADFRDKIELLRKLTRILEVERGLVFVNKAHDIIKTVERLKYHGLQVTALTKEAGKMERKRALELFSRGKAQLLVATDLAARGLDIPGIDYVFHLDVAENDKTYLHRAGRTGRAGKHGVSVSLVAPVESAKIAAFKKQLGIEIVDKKMINGKILDGIKRKEAVKPRRFDKRERG